MKQLNWATLGCGVIANELAQALSNEGRTLYSVANRTHEKAILDALYYEVCDMEKAVSSASSDEIETLMHCQYTYDVMKIMSDIRAEWGMKYPEEE